MTRLTSILLIPLYTAVLTTADYGVLGLIVMTGQIAGTMSGLGMTSALFRSYNDYDDTARQNRVISTAFIITMGSASLLTLLGYGFADRLSILLFANDLFRVHMILIGLITGFNLINQLVYAILRVRQRSIHYALLRTVTFLLEIGVIIYLVSIRQWGIMGVLAGRLIATTLTAIPLLWYVRGFLKPQFSLTDAQKMVAYGTPLVFAGLCGFVFTYTDRYFLNNFASLDDVGVYTLAYQFGMLFVVLLITPMKLVWGPMFLSIKEDTNFPHFCSLALTYVVLLGGFVFLGISLLTKEVIQLFSAPEYWRAYFVIPIISLTYFIWSTRSILEVGVALKRKTQFIALNSLIGALVNILLNFLLIPFFGIYGAAYATLATFVLMICIDYVYNQRLFPIRYEWERLVKIGVIITSLFLVGYFVPIQNLYLSACFKLILIGLYPLLLWIGRFFDASEIERIRATASLNYVRV